MREEKSKAQGKQRAVMNPTDFFHIALVVDDGDGDGEDRMAIE